MKALVFEQWQGGHHFNYLGVLVPALARMASEVTVAVSRRAAESDLFRTQLGHLRTMPRVRILDTVPIPSADDRLAFRRALGENVIEAADAVRPDVLVLPSGDEQLIALPLLDAIRGHPVLRDTHVETLLHYPAFTKSGNWRTMVANRVQRVLAGRGTLDRIGFVNFLQHEAAVRTGEAWAAKTHAVGDPVPAPSPLSRTEARARLGLDPSALWFGTIGGLDVRKAVPETIAAFQRARLPSHARLLVAGKLAEQHAAWIDAHAADIRRDGRLVVLDRFLSEDELLATFAAVDVQCPVYRDFVGLSSLLLKGVAAGAATLGSDFGWSRAVIRRFGLGRCVQPADVDGFAAAMETLAGEFGGGAPPYRAACVEALLAFHAPANFAALVLEQATAMAGVAPDAPPIRWEDVVATLPAETDLRAAA